MHLTNELRSRVANKLADCLKLAEAKYGQKFAMPHVSYDLRGATAGKASCPTWSIKLNGQLLAENADDFIARTVPHELAHLITDRVYPEAHRGRGITFTSTGKVRRAKREVHGPRWQSVALALGMEDVTRCHTYDTTNTRVVKSNGRQIEWLCPCGHKLMLTPKMSAELLQKPGSRWHRGCKGRNLVLVDKSVLPEGRVHTPTVYRAPAPVHAQKPAAPVAVPNGASKIETCRALFKANPTLSRQEMIGLFVNKANCTPAGAGTYYQTLKKG